MTLARQLYIYGKYLLVRWSEEVQKVEATRLANNKADMQWYHSPMRNRLLQVIERHEGRLNKGKLPANNTHDVYKFRIERVKFYMLRRFPQPRTVVITAIQKINKPALEYSIV